MISVIQVTYNSARYVVPSLESAQEAAERAGFACELLVVDNASSDGTPRIVAERWPSARVLTNTENVGFGRANNQAFELAKGDAWLLLNPDAILDLHALTPLVRFLADHPRVGAVAPAVDAAWHGGPEAGGMAPGLRSMVGHFLFLNRLLPGDRGGPWRGVMLHQRRHLGARRVDWLSGAALLLRPESIRSVGGFDPRYFLYSEDVDLGERLRRAGWESWTVPEARASHLKAGSQGRISARWVEAAHRHYAERAGRPSVLAHDAVLAIGMSVRALGWAFRDRSPEGRIRSRTAALSARQAWRLTLRQLVGGAAGDHR